MGLVWFVVLWLAGLFEGGIIAGATAKSPLRGYQAGHAAGKAFADRYGMMIFCVAVVAAIVGTATGFLPGTRKKRPPQDSGTTTSA
jgi:hypothetical protein